MISPPHLTKYPDSHFTSLLLGISSVLIICVLLTPVSGSSVNVPLDHWSYRDIDTLIGFGLIQTAMLGTKPFTRDEMARLIVEAIPKREDLPYRQRTVANRLLKRLLRAFQDEVNARTGGKDAAPTTFLKPLSEISAQAVYLDGRPTTMVRESQIDATEGTPLLRNNEGITYRDGANLMLTASAYAKLWDHFAFFLQPLFLLRPDDSVDADVRLHKGYLKASLGPFELEFGRDSLWWGQGARGTLVFSNHARPLDLVQLSMPHPAKLPWIFRYLGLTKAAIFFSILEEDRDVPRAHLLGSRLQIKPLPWLELGVVGGVQFNGEGVPNLDLGDWVEILFFGSPAGKTNQIAALDLRLTLPFLRYSEFYVEYGGEDTGNFDKGFPSSPLLDDVAFVVGLYVPRLTDDGRTTFRFEWMANNFSNDNTPGIWYNNSTFTSGFTFQQRILGHAAGGDGAEFFGRLTRVISKRATLGGDFSYRWRGDIMLNEPQYQKERRYSGGVDLQYFFSDRWEGRARFALEAVDNFNLTPGDDRTNTMFWLNVKYHFS